MCVNEEEGAAILLMVPMMKNDDVEHDVKDELIVDSRRRLEQHNIMSSTTGARTRRKTKSNT